jgi:hypothetical protein
MRSYRSSTLDPRVNKLWFQRYPGLAVQIKAVITHRAAVSTELMMMIARAARTSQSSHDNCTNAAKRNKDALDAAVAVLAAGMQNMA